jgi:inhibitor of Bruton tyrosine kinase
MYHRDGLAWTNNRPTPSGAVTQGLSFAAIQEQQSVKPPVCGPPKSLREIQDEEQEAAFLIWFEEESARLRKQEEAIPASSYGGEPQIHGGQTKRAGHAKRGRGRERGRGRARGQGPGRTASEVST